MSCWSMGHKEANSAQTAAEGERVINELTEFLTESQHARIIFAPINLDATAEVQINGEVKLTRTGQMP